jgi:hypothetical protein
LILDLYIQSINKKIKVMRTTITFIAIIVTLGIAFLINSTSLAILAGFVLGIKLGEAIFNFKF